MCVRIQAILVLASGLAACGWIGGDGGRFGNAFTHEGVRYDADLKEDSRDARNFVIAISPAAARPEIAQEAGRYEATRHCLRRWGGSDKEWIIGPDTPVEALEIAGDTLTLTGRCTQF